MGSGMEEPQLAGFRDLSTELLDAAGRGDTPRLELLLRAGANPSCKGWIANRPLHVACARGQLAAVEALLQHGARVDARNAARATALHEAAAHGQLLCAEALVLFGADASAADRFGSTPLHCASRHGHLRVVRLLLASGSDHTARDELGMTARHHAKQQAKGHRPRAAGPVAEPETASLARHRAQAAARATSALSSATIEGRCAEVARVLAEENLATAAAIQLLRALQRLAWGCAMHGRLGGGRGGSAAHMLPFELAASVANALSQDGAYRLLRRHSAEQRRGHRARPLTVHGGALQTLSRGCSAVQVESRPAEKQPTKQEARAGSRRKQRKQRRHRQPVIIAAAADHAAHGQSLE